MTTPLPDPVAAIAAAEDRAHAAHLAGACAASEWSCSDCERADR